jgi:RNA polymerase sigma-70 factor (ECF subfamily)
MGTTTVEDWVHQYADDLYSWAYYKTSHKESAEDLVQETFLSALQHVGRFEGKSSPKTWLFSILNNRIIDYHRRNFKNIVSPESYLKTQNGFSILDHLFDEEGHWKKSLQPQQWASEESSLLDDREFIGELEKCMSKLPSNWFSALQLKYLEEKEGTAICQELDITPSNFWQILHRAKLQLRQCLEVHWFKK